MVGGRFNKQGNLHTWQRYSWWSSWLACLVHIYHKFLHLVLLPESVHFLFSQKTFWHKIGLFFAFQTYFSEIIQMFHSCLLPIDSDFYSEKKEIFFFSHYDLYISVHWKVGSSFIFTDITMPVVCLHCVFQRFQKSENNINTVKCLGLQSDPTKHSFNFIIVIENPASLRPRCVWVHEEHVCLASWLHMADFVYQAFLSVPSAWLGRLLVGGLLKVALWWLLGLLY